MYSLSVCFIIDDYSYEIVSLESLHLFLIHSLIYQNLHWLNDDKYTYEINLDGELVDCKEWH